MKKRLLKYLLSFTALGVFLVGCNNSLVKTGNKNANSGSSSYTTTLTFTLSDDGTYYIVSDKNFTLDTPNVVIPEYYQGKPVKEIANDAFAEKGWIKSVVVPSTIEKIGHGAFSSNSIEKVYFNAINCKDFDAKNWVFYPTEISKPIEIVIGEQVERIPARLCYPLSTFPELNPNIKKITFPENSSLREIGDYAFYNVDDFETINFPSTLEKIGDYAFYGSSITELTFPESLVEIGAHAFDTSRKLTTINFNDDLEVLGEASFRYCASLEELNIECENLTEISKDAFKYCRDLTSVTINNVTKVGDSSFEGCTSLKAISYSSVEEIGPYAFLNCESLKVIDLPEKLTTLNFASFMNCTGVETINVYSNQLKDLEAANKTFYAVGANIEEGTVCNIMDGVTYVPERLFLSSSLEVGKPNIKTINIMSNIEEIRANAFALIEADVYYVGTKTAWSQVDVLYGNKCFEKVNCVKTLGGN